MECISNNISTSNVTFDAQSQVIEDLQQQLHHANQQLQNGNLLTNEMELEIERLQALIDFNENTGKLEKSDLTRQFNEKINSLQCVLEEERENAKKEIADLREKVDFLKQNTLREDALNDHELLKEQVQSLKDELKEAKDQLADCKVISCNVEMANSQLVEKMKELEEELEVTKEMLRSKTDSLLSSIKAFEELKEEKLLLSSELAILKAGPLENKDRGNSLFSEVDIKRQEIEGKMNLLRNKYLQAKKVLALKSNEMESLKAENRKIKMFCDEEVSNVRLREQKLLESYKQTNNELRFLISKLELRPESPKIITISDIDMSNMQWIHTVIDEARTEARELRKAYENKSCEILLVEGKLYSMSIETKNLKMQAMKDEARIEELQSKLVAFENADNTINPNEEGTLPDKKVTFNGEEKKLSGEINGVPSSKSVRFAEDLK